MPNNPFIQFLCKQADPENSKGRGVLAHLKRGIGKPPGLSPEMFPYVVPFLPKQPKSHEEDAYYLIASLFAIHPEHKDEIKSMGNTFNEIDIRMKKESNINEKEKTSSIERRFIAMLNAYIDDLPKHLRHAVSLARSKEVGVNYEKLLFDFIHWGRESRDIQKKWAKDFWSEKKIKSDDSISSNEENEKEEE